MREDARPGTKDTKLKNLISLAIQGTQVLVYTKTHLSFYFFIFQFFLFFSILKKKRKKKKKRKHMKKQ